MKPNTTRNSARDAALEPAERIVPAAFDPFLNLLCVRRAETHFKSRRARDGSLIAHFHDGRASEASVLFRAYLRTAPAQTRAQAARLLRKYRAAQAPQLQKARQHRRARGLRMRCEKCGTEFNPADTAKLSDPNGQAAQVVSACPECGDAYYDFTSGTWTREETFEAFKAGQPNAA